MPAASAQLNHFITAGQASSPSRPSFWSRALRAIQVSRLAQAEAQVARLIEARGSRFTDSLEREIERQII